MSSIFLLIPPVAAAILSYALAPLAGRLAICVGALDYPGPRKIHRAAMPRFGGLAVIAAAAIVALGSWVLFRSAVESLPEGLLAGVALGLVPVLAVSIKDDIKPVGPWFKVCGQVAGALIAVSWGVSLGRDIHLFGQTIPLGAAAVPLSIAWIVGVTNAFNLVDGLDGLSVGLALISTSSLAGVFLVVGQTGMAATALAMAGALCGFLPYNLFPARLFLGDAGANAIGFCLAAFALRGGSTLSAGMATLLPVFVLGLPIADTTISIARRLIKSIEQRGSGGVFQPDTNHIHHRLLALGIDHARAVRILYAVGLVLGGAALVSLFMTARDSALLVLALLLAGFAGLRRLGYDEFALIRKGVILRFYDVPVVNQSMFVVFADMLMVLLSALCAAALKTGAWDAGGYREQMLALVAVFAPMTVATFWLTGMYRGSWRVADLEEFVRACGAVIAATFFATIVGNGLLSRHVPVSVFVITGLVLLLLTNGSRASYAVLMASKRRAARTGVPVLIYGAGWRGARAARELFANADAGMRPVGFIDDDPTKWRRTVNGLPVFGPLGALDEAIQRLAVRAVVVAIRKISDARIRRGRQICDALGVELLEVRISFEPCFRQAREHDAAVAGAGMAPHVVAHPVWRDHAAAPAFLSTRQPQQIQTGGRRLARIVTK